MISKSLYFNLMKEDWKRRLWVNALSLLVFFFSMPVPMILITGDYSWYSDNRQEQIRYMSMRAEDWLSTYNTVIICIIVIAAIVCGISSFSYLHSKKKVDFYHSIPVKRTTLFSVYFINGIIMVALWYFLSLMLAFAIAAVNGSGVKLTVVLTAYLYHMSHFVLIYATVVVAMMLTGHMIVGLLGIGVFLFYGPGVSLIVNLYYQSWFQTYCHSNDSIFSQLLLRISPLFAYIGFAQIPEGNGSTVLTRLIPVLLIAGVLTALSLFLYKKRPSEAAGKAMAFSVSKSVIKILLVIPLSLASGLFFWELRHEFGWAVFGLVCGSILSHTVIEIIYNFDFKQLFSHKRHLLLCTAASLMVFCIFQFDLFGYETYLPKAGQIKSAAINITRLDGWVTYGNVSLKPVGHKMNYTWKYKNETDYIFQNMKLTNPEQVLEIAKKGIEWNQGEQTDISGSYTNVHVDYTLKSGKHVRRSYSLPINYVMEPIQQLYQEPEYKKGVFPILTQTVEETSTVCYQEINQVEKLKLGREHGTEAQLAELLAVYQEELSQLTIDTRREENPIGVVQFMTNDLSEAIKFSMELKNGNHYNLEDRTYYPVYPSFHKTIALLEQYGAEVSNKIDAKRISEIKIIDEMPGPVTTEEPEYEKEVERKTYRITDKEEIKEILPSLVPSDYYDMNLLNQIDEYSQVYVTLGNGVDSEEIICYFTVDKIPEFLKKRLNFDLTRKDKKMFD